jgi:hypothetical protein
MVQFPEFPSLNLCIQLRMICVYRIPGSPIRISADLCLLAAPRSFSQLATSFFGSWHLGIHPAPFTIYSYKTLDHSYFLTVLQHSVTGQARYKTSQPNQKDL